MRKIFLLTFILLLQVTLLIPNMSSPASATKEKQESKSAEKVEVKEATKTEASDIPLTSGNHLLEGLVDQVHFYYEVAVDKLEGSNYAQIHVDYSDLLLDGSTITVAVDDEPIESYRLKSGEKEQTFKVPLKGKALTRGFHHITVAFYGEISKEMCTNEENPANWLTILSDSYIHLEMGDSFADRQNMLADYPYPFVQVNKAKEMQAKIVIPNNASGEIITSALDLANYLNGKAVEKDPIDIVFEKEIEKIDQHLILIGRVSDWEGSLQQYVSETANELSNDELAISNRVIKTEDGHKQIMIMTAKDDETIASLSSIMTVDDYLKQLTKNDIRLKELPKLEKEEVLDKVSFKRMNMPDINLSGVTSQSEFYFYDLPTYIDRTKLAYLHLKMKFSKTLLYESEYSHPLSELTIYINGVPHSVSIRDLEEDSDGFYRLALPISDSTLQKEAIMSVQFAGNGLKEREPCLPPSEEKWIFIEDSSYVEYATVRSQNKSADFYEWPSPFVSSDEAVNTLVILTEDLNTDTLNQVQLITNSLRAKGNLAPIKVTNTEEVTDKQLSENNLIVIGSLAEWDAWKDHEDDLLVKLDRSASLQVDEFGFLKETAKHVGFIQDSLWNNEHILAVFSSVNSDNTSFVSKSLIEYLQQEKAHTNLIVETLAGDIFTNELADETLENEPTVDNEKETPPWILYVFISIFILAVIIFIIVLRLMRKRKMSE